MFFCVLDVVYQNVEFLSLFEGVVFGEWIWFGLEEDKESQKVFVVLNQVWFF